MNINLINNRRVYRAGRWFQSQMSRIHKYDTPLWQTALAGVWVMCTVAMIIAGLGMPTGLGVGFDLVMFTDLNTVAMALASAVIAVLLALMSVPIPRFFAGSAVYTGTVVYLILFNAELGMTMSITLSVAITTFGTLAGIFSFILVSRRVSRINKLTYVSLVGVLCLTLAFWPAQEEASTPAIGSENESVPPLNVANPARSGPFTYQYFTYGSGQDRQRQEFAEGADVITSSVDASGYIERWPWLRSLFWGFDQKALPLNGRVWMPEGRGPFPLVLMVHGNHLMEKFSDAGYGYLGELLASRGFIAVSIDENFLNYSVWSDIPDQDMKVRAWMLLKHLQQIQALSELQDTPFFQRVDWGRIALLGHSRGGQAVAMAADRSRWFVADKSLLSLDTVRIQAIIALAPTDKVIDHKSANLHDIYYLTLQGARDADVNNFYGDRQYIRSSYSENTDRFKASLYIANANHSQFNTDWGYLDDRLPGGLFLNRKEQMDDSEQREVAKVYVSAFLEAAFHKEEEYIKLFRDYRTGLDWLPNSRYFNRFENGLFLELVRFDDDRDKTTLGKGMTVEAKGLAQWVEQIAEDRQHKEKGTRGSVIEWREGGSYTINITDTVRKSIKVSNLSSLMFSMANMERDLKKTDVDSIPIPKLELELESRGGISVRLPLAKVMPVYSSVYTTFTRIPWLENRMKEGKYKEAAEPVFQTYELPLHLFQDANPDFVPTDLTRLTFHFVDGPGKIILDDIGFMTEPLSLLQYLVKEL